MATKKPATKKPARRAPTKSAASRRGGAAARGERGVVVLVATRKGAWIHRADSGRRTWRVDGPHFLGNVIHHLVLDPRDGRTLLAAAKTGHLGPTIFRSTDFGKTWKESSQPPAFRKAREGEKGRVVNHTFWLTPGHASERGSWYAGTAPQGLFRSEDGGATWESVSGYNENAQLRKWMGSEQDGTPDLPKLHSIIVDPRNPAHLYLGMSGGGFHESTDRGRTWRALLDGMEVVEGFDASDPSFHDPHCVRICPTNPDRLYQQNHCGIYRLDRPGTKWTRIGRAMPKKVGDIGFPIVVHPRDADVAWVLPMDGTTVWPRTSPDGKPAVYRTRDAGNTWERQDRGLPRELAFWTVYRQAMTADRQDPVGLYFGTTSGEIWMSENEGADWRVLAQHLPVVQSLTLGA